MVDLHAVGHHRLDRLLGQAQHAADHHPLAAIEQRSLAGAPFEHVGDFLAHLIGLDLATEQAQHRVGGTLAHATAVLQLALALVPHQLVGQLDKDGEANRRVQVALGNMEAQALGGEAEADHHQEAQAQHDHCRVGVDEGGQRLAGDDHQADGDDHGDHHHFQMLDHAYRGDYRVQREHRIEHDDLRHHRPEQRVGATAATRLVGTPLEALVQLHGGLEQQEHAAEQHDQVTAGEALAEHLDQRLGQGHQPGDAGQQAQAHQQGQAQADQPRAVAQVRRQLVGEDRDEHQVVDAQDDFQDDQRQQAEPRGGVGHPFEDHAFLQAAEYSAQTRRSRRRAWLSTEFGARCAGAPEKRWPLGGGWQQSLSMGSVDGKRDHHANGSPANA